MNAALSRWENEGGAISLREAWPPPGEVGDLSVNEPDAAQHVLLVEDDAILAECLESLLRDFGFEDVHWANCVEAAERDLSSRTPCFAVLDVNLGSELVFPVAEELQRRAVPFVFCSGLSRERLPIAWTRQAFISKPLTREALAKVVHALLPPAAPDA